MRTLKLRILGLALAAGAVTAVVLTERVAVPACHPAHGKGGMGVIGPSIWVVTKSDRNQLLWHADSDGMPDAGEWEGAAHETAQSVFIFGGGVRSGGELPADFDINQAIVVAFAPNRIQSFNFATRSGCYYLRGYEKQ